MHKEDQERLQRQAADVTRAQLVSVLDTAVDAIIISDETGTILLYNAACEKLFGWAADEAIGRNLRIIMAKEDAERHDNYISKYVKGGRPKIIGVGRGVQGRHKDGTVFPLDLSVGVAKSEHGRQFIGIMRDLRPRKEAEERIAALQAQLIHMARVNAMDEMGAALAHELNQPLTAIILYLQATRRKMNAHQTLGADEEKILGVLEKAVREAERAGSIIERMRHFVEKREPKHEAVDLRQLIEDALELATIGLKAMTVKIFREDSDEPLLVMVDPVQIQQVIVNLVRNAVEVVKERDNPWVCLTTRKDDDNVYFDVEDSGPGIPAHIMPELFKAFSSTKRTGMGLGLAISRSIAQNHQGELDVSPGGNGKGATFCLRLPCLTRADNLDRNE